MQDGHSAIELHHFRLHELLLVMVPLGTFKEETCDVCTILGLFGDVTDWAWGWDEIEFKSVDGWAIDILTCVLLLQSGCETNGVSVRRDPVHSWREGHLVGPGHKEFVPLTEFNIPVGKVLERQIGKSPFLRHGILTQADHHTFQIWRDKDKTLDTLLKLFERLGNNAKKDIITLNFLDEHNIKWTILVFLLKPIETLFDLRWVHYFRE
jgi:hypothetical protein